MIKNNKREPTFTGPLQFWPMVYITDYWLLITDYWLLIGAGP